MKFEDITLVIGIDREHLEELRWTWPTWMRFKPELREMPLVVFYDSREVNLSSVGFLNDHPNWRGVAWDWDGGINQREKMITGWVYVPAREVRTPWYLKLDTDVVAVGYGPWIFDEWFLPSENGELPVFISSKWSYSKPRNVIDVLNDWGDGIRQLTEFPRLDITFSPDSQCVVHPRIISWFFIGRTDWTKEVSAWLSPTNRLPHPSQDTFLFYCAERQRKYYVRERMKVFWWEHLRLGRIQERVRELGIFAAELS